MDSTKKYIVDRSKYDAKTITTYNVLGAYIVNLYYNHFYIEATKMKNDKKVPSITEGYKHVMFRWLSVMDSTLKTYQPKHFKRLLDELKNYFAEHTSFETLTISEFIDRITSEMVPHNIHKSMDNNQKQIILRNILIRAYNAFTSAVVKEFMVLIIDNHEETANIVVLKDKILEIFLFEREQLYQKFIDSSAGRSGSEKVDRTLVTRIQESAKKYVEENKKLKEMLTELINKNKDTEKQFYELYNKYKIVVGKYKYTKEENVMLQHKIVELRESRKFDGGNVSIGMGNKLRENYQQTFVGGRTKNTRSNYEDDDENDNDDEPEEIVIGDSEFSGNTHGSKKAVMSEHTMSDVEEKTPAEMDEVINQHIVDDTLPKKQRGRPKKLSHQNGSPKKEKPSQKELSPKSPTEILKSAVDDISHSTMGPEPSIGDIY